MEFIVEKKNGHKVIKFIGNMDVQGVHKIEKQLLEDVKKEKNLRIVFDLSKVDFISSAGLRVLVASLKASQENDSQLILSGLKPSVQKVFEIVDMSSMFQIRKTLDEAIS